MAIEHIGSSPCVSTELTKPLATELSKPLARPLAAELIKPLPTGLTGVMFVGKRASSPHLSASPPHTSVYVSIRQHTSSGCSAHLSASPPHNAHTHAMPLASTSSTSTNTCPNLHRHMPCLYPQPHAHARQAHHTSSHIPTCLVKTSLAIVSSSLSLSLSRARTLSPPRALSLSLFLEP